MGASRGPRGMRLGCALSRRRRRRRSSAHDTARRRIRSIHKPTHPNTNSCDIQSQRRQRTASARHTQAPCRRAAPASSLPSNKASACSLGKAAAGSRDHDTRPGAPPLLGCRRRRLCVDPADWAASWIFFVFAPASCMAIDDDDGSRCSRPSQPAVAMEGENVKLVYALPEKLQGARGKWVGACQALRVG